MRDDSQVTAPGATRPAAGEWRNQVPRATGAGIPRRPPGDNTQYDVRWVMDITAPNPVEAARKALRAQRNPSSWATVFIVAELREDGARWRVDLDDPGNSTEVLRTRETAWLIASAGLGTAAGPGDPEAPTRLLALRAALGRARQSLCGDSIDAGREALQCLAEGVTTFLGEKAPAQAGNGPRYVAHFMPEAWVNRQAIDVDPAGPQEWDCTKHAERNRDYLSQLEAHSESLDSPEGAVDSDDVLKDDPAAPEWIREWRGPFTIRITRTSRPA